MVPEIASALSVTPQAYRAPFGIKPKSGEMRFERIERWHRHGHSHPKIDPNAEGRVLKALCVTKLWDEWTAARERHSGHENWTFASCLKNLYEPKKLAALGSLKESHGNQLKQFCHDIGLKPFQSSDFKSRMTDLELVLTRIRDDYQLTHQK